MSLRWKSFEKTLRSRVRVEVRASELLRREERHVRNIWRRHFRVPPWAIRPLLFLAVGSTMNNTSAPVAQIVAFIWLWVLAAAFLRAFQWSSALYLAPTLNVFQHLPVSDERIFQIQSHDALRKSLWSAADFALLYCMLLYRAGGGLNSIWYGAVLGIVQWMFVVALAGVLFAWGPRRHAAWLMILFGGLAISMFWVTKPGLLDSLNTFARWIPPLGWLPQGAGDSYSSGLARHLPPTLVWAVVLAAFPLAWRGVRRAYVLSDTEFAAARQMTNTAESAAAASQELVGHFTTPPETVEAVVRGGGLMTGLDWRQAGPVERIIAKLLTARERLVAEFLVAGHPGWTKKFRNALTVTVLGVLGARLLVRFEKLDPVFIILMGMYFIIVQAVGSWRGFATISPAGVQPPGYSFYPVSFRDLFVTMLKINTARCALLLPLVAGFVLLLGGKLGSVFDASAWWRLGLLGFLAQPILALSPISAATNDSSRWRFALPAVAYVIVMIGVGAAFVLLSRPALVLASGLTLAALIAAAVWLYARRFNRSRFDLMPDAIARN